MNKEHPLPFPAGRPDPYKPLVDEPIFNPAKHLALELPTETFKLGELGYQDSELQGFASDFAYSSAFRILSDEGVAAMRHVCEQIYDNRKRRYGGQSLG
jgi:phosphoribosyl 1,2-cyclic phosphodiesterase